MLEIIVMLKLLETFHIYAVFIVKTLKKDKNMT